jgi:hypothetical protein
MSDDEDKKVLNQSLFLKHIISLETGAWMFLGKISNPSTGKIDKNVAQAKNIIDILIMLREKTKGNLSEEETRILNQAITQVQYNFVEETILKKDQNPEDKKDENNKNTEDNA